MSSGNGIILDPDNLFNKSSLLEQAITLKSFESFSAMLFPIPKLAPVTNTVLIIFP